LYNTPISKLAKMIASTKAAAAANLYSRIPANRASIRITRVIGMAQHGENRHNEDTARHTQHAPSALAMTDTENSHISVPTVICALSALRAFVAN
jgi:hypothetical protein